MTTTPTLFSDEVQFAGWSDSHTSGPKVTLWLRDSEQLEAFRAMTVRKGNTAGQRLAMVLVQIGDDELPVAQEDAPADVPAPKGGQLAKLAGMMCQSHEFVEWLAHEFPVAHRKAEERLVESEPHEIAVAVLREVCGIKSRAELDHNEAAADRFHRFVRIPYADR